MAKRTLAHTSSACVGHPIVPVRELAWATRRTTAIALLFGILLLVGCGGGGGTSSSSTTGTSTQPTPADPTPPSTTTTPVKLQPPPGPVLFTAQPTISSLGGGYITVKGVEADINGDGRTDLVEFSGIGAKPQLMIGFGQPDGTFAAPVSAGYTFSMINDPAADSPWQVIPADLNSSGAGISLGHPPARKSVGQSRTSSHRLQMTAGR